jgi:glycosyltransferase involved in cell wall biosynthesis
MNKKISVILPICDVELYLEECINSIINQTIGFENIELIMIDDGSIDNSYEIMKKYDDMYDNVKIHHFDERSGSAGKPRNKGIEMATGKYLMFSDPDDFFSLDAFEIMYEEIESKKADFVIANFSNTDEYGIPWEKPIFDLDRFKNFKLSINDYKDSFYVMNSSMCNKIFNRKFINKNDIKCLEGIPGEDTYFSMSAFLNSKKVYYIPNIIYYYRQRSSGETSVSWNCSFKFFDGMNKAYKALYDKFVEKNEINFYKFIYARNMTYLLYRFIDSNQLKYDERLDIIASTRWFYKLSKDLNVPACQKSLETLIDKIIAGEYRDVIDICNIISEMRKYMPDNVRYSMSKPTREMIEEIIKGIKEPVCN